MLCYSTCQTDPAGGTCTSAWYSTAQPDVNPTCSELLLQRLKDAFLVDQLLQDGPNVVATQGEAVYVELSSQRTSG
jgi:hypothetical protein